FRAPASPRHERRVFTRQLDRVYLPLSHIHYLVGIALWRCISADGDLCAVYRRSDVLGIREVVLLDDHTPPRVGELRRVAHDGSYLVPSSNELGQNAASRLAGSTV